MFLCISLIISAKTSFGQTITGSVSNTADFLSGAKVQNLHFKAVTFSDIKGTFKLNASQGDTLVLSYIGYRNDTLIVGNEQFIKVILQPANNVLREVLIRGNRLTPLQQYQKNQEEFKQIYRIGDKSHMVSIGLGIGLNIDALYSALSKEGKDARRMQKTLTTDYQNSLVDSRFTKELVSSITGYQKQRLDDFMMENRPSFAFIQNSSDYELIQYIQRKAVGISSKADNPIVPKSSEHGFKLKFNQRCISTNTHIPDHYIP